MRKMIFVALLISMSTLLTGCFRNFATLPITNDMDNLKGKTKQEILAMYGKPTDPPNTSADVWDYKKTAKAPLNYMMSLTPMPLLSTDIYPNVDVTRLKFRGGKVVSVEYMENILNGTQAQTKQLREELMIGNGKEEHPFLKYMQADIKESEGNSKEHIQESVPPPSKKEAPPKVAKATKDSKKYAGSTVKKVKGDLCAQAKKLGMKVESKGEKVIITTPDGEKITTTFKQQKKAVVVEMASADAGAAHDIRDILE